MCFVSLAIYIAEHWCFGEYSIHVMLFLGIATWKIWSGLDITPILAIEVLELKIGRHFCISSTLLSGSYLLRLFLFINSLIYVGSMVATYWLARDLLKATMALIFPPTQIMV